MRLASRAVTFKSMILLMMLVSRGEACEVEEKKIPSTTIFVSQDLQNWGFDFKSQSNTLTFSKCSSIQLALGINLPSPQDFSTETWMKSTATDLRRCEIATGLSHVRSSFRTDSKDLQSTFQLASECVGIQVVDTTGGKVQLGNSINCNVIRESSRKDAIVLQGDNCVVLAASKNSRLQVQPLYLKETCSSSSIVRSHGSVDFDMSLKAFVIGQAESHSEFLGDKNVKVVFSEQGENTRNSRVRSKDFPVTKSSQYALSFELADLRLSGSKDTGIVAGTQFYVSQQTRAHLPFVVRSSVFLLKKEGTEDMHLGSWYSGSIIPPNWQGLDGLSELHSIAVTQENFNLNKNVQLIEKGDQLMVVARLESPNAGPLKFWRYFRNLFRSPTVGRSRELESNVTNAIDPIEQISLISDVDQVNALPELGSLSSHTRSALQQFSRKWPVTFETFCNESRSVCRPIDDLDIFTEIKATYGVEDVDFEIKVKPIKYTKKSSIEKAFSSPLSTKTVLKCY